MMLPMVASAWVRDLWAPDEPRYAQVAREIFSGGDALVMHLCGELYPDKPPLLFWLSGLFGWLSGWSEFWMRAPNLIATLLTAWLIARLARRWWGDVEASWSAAVYLTFAMVVEIGGRLQIDPLLNLFCVFALVAFTNPAGDARSRSRWILLGGLAMGIGALAKGPLVHVNVLLVLLAWRLAGLRAEGARVRAWVWPTALLLSVAPVLTWAVAASLADHRLFEALFFDQHVGRVTKADRHPGPWWKHAAHLVPLMLPWTVVTLAALGTAWRELRRRGEEAADRDLVRAGLWFAVLFIFFSAIPPKRTLYLLPAYPALALVTARFMAVRARAGGLPRWVGWTTCLLLAALGALLCAVGVLRPGELPGLVWRSGLLGATLIAGSLLALRFFRRNNHNSWARSVTVSWVVLTTLLAVLVFAVVNPMKSGRYLAAEIAGLEQRPQQIPCLGVRPRMGVRPEAYRFYGGLPTVAVDELAPHRERDGADFIAMVLRRQWDEMPEDERSTMRVLINRRVGSKDILVLGSAFPTPETR
jgi:4-amino-4-deoxy-L-arabinose transferase-like glycosyltransferase